MITTQMTKDNWNLTKNKLKLKWPALTDADLQCSEGGHDALVGRIEKRTSQTRDAVEQAIKDCAPADACTTSTSTKAATKPAPAPVSPSAPVVHENKENWVAASTKLKQKWPALTEADLQFVVGGREAMVERIQKRTGETREAVEKAVKECSSGTCCSTSVAPAAKTGLNSPVSPASGQTPPAKTPRAA